MIHIFFYINSHEKEVDDTPLALETRDYPEPKTSDYKASRRYKKEKEWQMNTIERIEKQLNTYNTEIEKKGTKTLLQNGAQHPYM